jgi:hypothetical protein
MKTKFEKTLTAATAATIATVLSLTAPAKANSEVDQLIDALAPYMPTQDRMQIKTDNDLLKEFELDNIFTLDGDIDDLQVAFLGEAAGQHNNLSYSSSNGLDGTIWESTRSLEQLYDYGYQRPDGSYGKVGTFGKVDGLENYPQYLQVGTTAGLGPFTKGDTLDLTLSGLSLSQNSEHFKAYTFKGFEDWVILGIEDDNTQWSDWDFNDTVVAINLSKDVPEPSTMLGLLGVGAAGLFIRRKSLTK